MKANLAADHPDPRAGSGTVSRTKTPGLYKSPNPTRPARSPALNKSSVSTKSFKKRTHSQKPAAPPSRKDRSYSPLEPASGFDSEMNKSYSMISREPQTARGDLPNQLNPTTNLFKPLQPLRKKKAPASARGTPNTSFTARPAYPEEPESVHRYESSQQYPSFQTEIAASQRSVGPATERAPYPSEVPISESQAEHRQHSQPPPSERPMDPPTFFSGAFTSRAAETVRDDSANRRVSPPVTPPSVASVKGSGKVPPLNIQGAGKKKKPQPLKRPGTLKNFIVRPSPRQHVQQLQQLEQDTAELQVKQKALREKEKRLEKRTKKNKQNEKLAEVFRHETMRCDQGKIVAFQRWKSILVQLELEYRYSSQLEESNVNYALFRKYQEEFTSREIDSFSIDKDGSFVKPKIGESMIMAEVTAAYDTLKQRFVNALRENAKLEAQIKRTKLISMTRQWSNKQKILLGVAWVRWVACRERKLIARGRLDAARERALKKLNIIGEKKTRQLFMRWQEQSRIQKRTKILMAQELLAQEEELKGREPRDIRGLIEKDPLDKHSVLEVMSENRELKETVRILQKELTERGMQIPRPASNQKVNALRKILAMTLIRASLARPVTRNWRVFCTNI